MQGGRPRQAVAEEQPTFLAFLRRREDGRFESSSSAILFAAASDPLVLTGRLDPGDLGSRPTDRLNPASPSVR